MRCICSSPDIRNKRDIQRNKRDNKQTRGQMVLISLTWDFVFDEWPLAKAMLANVKCKLDLKYSHNY